MENQSRETLTQSTASARQNVSAQAQKPTDKAVSRTPLPRDTRFDLTPEWQKEAIGETHHHHHHHHHHHSDSGDGEHHHHHHHHHHKEKFNLGKFADRHMHNKTPRWVIPLALFLLVLLLAALFWANRKADYTNPNADKALTPTPTAATTATPTSTSTPTPTAATTTTPTPTSTPTPTATPTEGLTVSEDDESGYGGFIIVE